MVDPPPPYLERLRAEGKIADIYWKLKKHIIGRRTEAPGWTDRAAGILTDRTRANRCEVAPQFFRGPERKATVELHMDDLGSSAPSAAVRSMSSVSRAST